MSAKCQKRTFSTHTAALVHNSRRRARVAVDRRPSFFGLIVLARRPMAIDAARCRAELEVTTRKCSECSDPHVWQHTLARMAFNLVDRLTAVRAFVCGSKLRSTSLGKGHRHSNGLFLDRAVSLPSGDKCRLKNDQKSG